MKKKELYELSEALDRINQSGSKFCYLISKAKRLILQEIRIMEKRISVDPLYREFMEELEKLRMKHCERDQNGIPIKKQGTAPNGQQAMFYDIKDVGNPESPFLKDVKLLEEKYKDVVTAHLDMQKKYDEYLEEETELVLPKIALTIVPNDITQDEMDSIFSLIVEDYAKTPEAK